MIANTMDGIRGVVLMTTVFAGYRDLEGRGMMLRARALGCSAHGLSDTTTTRS